ncbi:MAG TPA: hypothetical protein VGO94_05195 [Mycobacteriales bacterium]|jgi:hypothetical protein|nr:hypothetical protein [Mycobacteriales bacterium]
MSPILTVLIFAGVPIAIMLAIAALVYGASAHRSPRYRPGRPFPVRPVWFLAARHAEALDRTGGNAVLAAGDAHAAIEARHTEADRPGDAPTAFAAQSKGGARGNW